VEAGPGGRGRSPGGTSLVGVSRAGAGGCTCVSGAPVALRRDLGAPRAKGVRQKVAAAAALATPTAPDAPVWQDLLRAFLRGHPGAPLHRSNTPKGGVGVVGVTCACGPALTRGTPAAHLRHLRPQGLHLVDVLARRWTQCPILLRPTQIAAHGALKRSPTIQRQGEFVGRARTECDHLPQ
jgi:hypothetical protein